MIKQLVTRRLEIEVDLQHSPGEVTLRFFIIEGERRQALRVQQLYNLIYQVRQEQDTGFSFDDEKMLRQLWAHVSRMHLLKSNLEVLKITMDLFNRWLELWEHVPERFIERRSRLPYTRRIPEAEVHFEVESHGETSKLSAMVSTPDGKRVPYCDVQRVKGPRGNEALVNGRLVTLSVPISETVMDQVFGDHNPTVPSAALTKNLPVLLENRLDLLRGPSVTRMVRRGKSEIRLKSDGADVLVSARIGNIDVISTTAPVPCGLQRKGKRFVVVEAQSKVWKPMLSFMQKLPIKADRQTWFRLAGDAANMSALDKAVRELPPGVTLTMDGDLQELFYTQSSLVPQLSLREGDGWIDVDVSCRVGDIELRGDELERISKIGEEFVRTRKGQWMRLPTKALGDFLEMLKKDGVDYGLHRKTRVEAQVVVKTVCRFSDLRMSKSSEALAEELRHLEDVEAAPISAELDSILRPYQKEGAEFLYNRSGYGVGCILADDMGLGKTVQTLAFVEALSSDRAKGGKFLVVCPASVIAVWTKEAKRFTPKVRVRALAGSPDQRREIVEQQDKWDVLVTNYAIVRNDFERLSAIAFDTVILDEAQQIKNPEAQITQCVKALQTRHRVALTGTPLENRLLDLWSIVDFLNPQYLGDSDQFKDKFVDTRQDRERLSKKIAPLLMRRTKDAVAPELPPRMEENLILPLSESQQIEYREYLKDAREKASSGGGFMQILAALTRLRQICCHPALIAKPGDPLDHLDSAKLDCLIGMLDELLEENHSALVFSQFTGMLAIIEEVLKARKVKYYKIIGETPTPKRMEIVDAFNDSKEPSVFLLSLRAAGTGLTLTKADYVFIFDPWWNPAVENQAIDRTHRIGQDKPVFAYRLITENTVEEKVLAMQEEKRQLFAELVDGAAQMPAGLTAEDLVSLLS